MQRLIRSTVISITQLTRSAQKINISIQIKSFKVCYRMAPRETIQFTVSPSDDRSLKIPIKTFVDNNLGQVLRSNKIPLEFKCGFSCECATCAIRIEPSEKQEEISGEQPMEHEESITLVSEGKDKTQFDLQRCQIFSQQQISYKTIDLD